MVIRGGGRLRKMSCRNRRMADGYMDGWMDRRRILLLTPSTRFFATLEVHVALMRLSLALKTARIE